MDAIRKIILLLCVVVLAVAQNAKRPCAEVSSGLRYPCRCTLEPADNASGANVKMDCDGIVFVGDFTTLPYGTPIIEFSQRYAGHQTVPTQLFASSGLPLRRLDFTGNSIRHLTDGFLNDVKDTLSELYLANNMLGDNLNPIFSTAEFHELVHLRLLDLSGNHIQAIEEGIFKGCDNLQDLNLNRNSLSTVPSASLNGPKSLKILSITQNRIGFIRSGAFTSQGTLERLNIGDNALTGLDGGALEGLTNLRELLLAGNRLTRLNSDVFEGVRYLDKLDLSRNFISSFPTVALKEILNLRHLNLSANMIKRLEVEHLTAVSGLQVLDLSRNSITGIPPGTFRELRSLRLLDISLNSLRTIEDDAFEGLDALETLILKDNNILLVPNSALGRLPRLSYLQLDYNRVSAISADILGSLTPGLTSLKLARNVIRELPTGTFEMFKMLAHLDLSGNLLTTLTVEVFVGIKDSLETLKLGENKIVLSNISPLSFPKLTLLDLSHNHITEIPKNAFSQLSSLQYLNLSGNIHLVTLTSTDLYDLHDLQVLDISNTGLTEVSNDLFSKSNKIERIYLNGNNIQEISEGTFSNLKKMSVLDLSNNRITTIHHSTFVNVMALQILLLNSNQLTAFKGEYFNTGTSLEELNLSDNRLTYLFPSSFRIHPRLRKITASRNKIILFPAELIANLQYLEYIDLSENRIKYIEELEFARLPRLREILLAKNELESVNEMAFHNSTQLQILDLSENRLDQLEERTFEGLVLLKLLNLEGNYLTELPEAIFERSRLQMLENINLAHNMFEVAPLNALQKQYPFISKLDLSHNIIREIPADDVTLMNVKILDLSYNPLSQESLATVIGEPKTLRELNLAATGVTNVTQLETPFLRHLNLSHNNITNMPETAFGRTTLLESLDLSNNQISNISSSLSKTWPLIKGMQSLNLSGNPIQSISQGDLNHLENLRSLSIHDLVKCMRIEGNAFKNLSNLAILQAYNYPSLGYLDVKGILQSLPALNTVDIDVKDSILGSDQLQPALHPRLRELCVRGSRLHSISSGALAGFKSLELIVRLKNTSLTSLPPALFFPVPRSTKVILDITGNSLSALTPQLLLALEDRRGDLTILGLESNPIQCDCGARALRRWILGSKMTNLRCSGPEYLKNRLLVEIGDDELTCDPRRLITAEPVTNFIQTTRKPVKITTEPDIIWSIAPTNSDKGKSKAPNIKTTAVGQQSTLSNDDTLIIGIVGGVVAFIAILIIIICIVRLRMTSTQYRGGPLANGAPHNGIPTVMGPGSACVSCKGPSPTLYAVPPPYAPTYATTLPSKVNGSGPPSLRPPYATMSRSGLPYYGAPQPYFISYPHNQDEKIYR